MDYRIIPESLPDDVKTEYLLRDMPINEVLQIVRKALSRVDFGTRNTYKIELWVRNEYDKQGNIDYLKHIINRGKLWYSDILKAFKLYNPFFEMDPSRPIDWIDTLMKEKKKEEVFLTDDFEYNPKPKMQPEITNPRWEHVDEQKKSQSPEAAAFKDTVRLLADVKNISDGHLVTFDIYDRFVSPPSKVDSAKGKVENGVAQVSWIVTDKGNGNDSLFEFDASVKGLITERCPVPLAIVYDYVFSG